MLGLSITRQSNNGAINLNVHSKNSMCCSDNSSNINNSSYNGNSTDKQYQQIATVTMNSIISFGHSTKIGSSSSNRSQNSRGPCNLSIACTWTSFKSFPALQPTVSPKRESIPNPRAAKPNKSTLKSS